MSSWQLQEAKARLSEVVKKAANEGPQRITLHGKPAAVVLSEADYRRLRKPPGRFLDLLRQSPLVDAELDLERQDDRLRDLDL